MKIAVCLYGYPRHFEDGIKSLRHFLHGTEHDLFIHAWHEASGSNDIELNSIHSEISNLFTPVSFVLEKQIEFKKTFDFPHDTSGLKPELLNQGIGVSSFLSTLYSIKQVGELLKKSLNEYDLVILTRMDVFSYKQLKDYQFASLDEIYSSFCYGRIWDLNKGGEAIDLKLIASNQKNMESLMNVYEFVEDYIRRDKIKVCHHRVLAYHLKKLNQRFHMMFPENANWFLIKDAGVLKGEFMDSNITQYSNIFR